MKKTIQDLREARGESRAQLAHAVGVIPSVVADWEAGKAEPTVSRLKILTKHFGVRDDQIDLRPGHEPSIGERLADLL